MKQNFSEIFSAAHSAGMKALNDCIPVPMTVAGGNREWYVSEGACGFAWVEFAGNTAFGRWAKKTGNARPHYPSGLSVWVGEGGQSIARKEAYAQAFANVLRDFGIKAYAGSRLD